MTTRMVHPQHGATHAYDGGEIERLKEQGWSVEILAPEIQRCIAPALEQLRTSFEADLRAIAERKKPGPKPKAK